MKRFYLFVTTFLLVTTGSSAQVLSGIITDAQQGTLLDGASVTLLEASRGTVSDNSGHYSFQNVTPGTYTVQVNFLGYASQSKKIIVRDDKTLNYELVPESFLQKQVVVTANKISVNRDQVPMTISVITEKEIEQSSESNVLPVISRYVPGLFVTERGISGFGLSSGSAGKISIRGVGGSESSFPVLVLIDGQPQFMGIFGHPIPDSYASSDIEKIEVIKGPASILYGTNAMGGVINLITKNPKKDGFSFKGHGMTGSFSTWKLNGSAAYKKGKLNIFTSWNHDETDGHRDNSGFKIDNVFAKVAYDFNEHFSLSSNFNRSCFKAYDPGSIYVDDPSIYENNTFWVDIVRTNSYLTLSNKYDKVEGGLKVYYMNGDHVVSNGPDEDWNSIDENYGFSFYQGLKLFPGNLISVGLEAKKYGGKGSPVVVPKFENGQVVGMQPSPYDNKWIDISETGFYGIIQQQLWEKLTLNTGLRHENHSLFGDEWIPQFGVSLEISENMKLKTSASKGFRSPSVRELYLFPPANPLLKPEEMWNYEFSWTQYFLSKKLRTQLNAFIAEGENLIMTLPNPSPPPSVLNINSGEFSHKGIEMEVRYQMTNQMTLNGNYSFLSMDSPKVSSPEHQLFLGVNYRLNAFCFNIDFQHIGKLYTNINPEVTQNYNLLNAKVDYQLSRHIQLFVSGENLFDKNYEVQYGYPMPGITIFSGFNINF